MSPREFKQIKGAAGRRAAVAAAGKQLRLARETALAAKCRVVVVRGVLYYGRSSALEDAEALLDPYAVPSPDAQGVCAALDVRWLWPTISKEVVQERFAAFGAIKSVQLSAPTWGPKTGLRIAENYNIATVTYLAKASAVAARRALDGASVYLNGAANIHDPIPASSRFASLAYLTTTTTMPTTAAVAAAAAAAAGSPGWMPRRMTVSTTTWTSLTAITTTVSERAFGAHMHRTQPA